MSHRKFEHPRCGSLAFLPRKRCRHHRGKIRSFPPDDDSQPPHLTAFMVYKAGMTHVVRELDRPGSKMNKKEIVEPVSVLEAPPMIVVGMVGYTRSPYGLRCLATVWANNLSETFKRAYYKNWYKSKKKCFKKYHAKLANESGKKYYEKNVAKIKKYCQVVRVIAHTQVKKLHFGQKKANVMEIQINGGSVEKKVEYGMGLFESEVPVEAVFKSSEMVDTIAVTRGKGFEGVVHRWGVTRLPRKTHKGLRKVACIGAWHPSRVAYTVPRAGQNGYHHRTEVHKKVYHVAKGVATEPHNGKTTADLTEKAITPMGGFPHYGQVLEDFMLIKGSVPGPIKRPLTLRKLLSPNTTRMATEEISLRFIDTSSKLGHGKWQTTAEKDKFMGPTKRRALKSENAEA